MKTRLSKILVSFALLFTVLFNIGPSNIHADELSTYNGVDIREYFEDGFKTIITDAKIIFYDKEGNPVLPTQVHVGDRSKLQYDFVIPNDLAVQIKDGDYFEFKLPEGVKMTNVVDSILVFEGIEYGKLHVDMEGNIKITFNDQVASMSDISGTEFVEGRLDDEIIKNPGDHTIKIPIEDETIDIPIFVKPQVDKTIEKLGSLYNKVTGSGTNADHAVWDVIINKNLDELVNPIVRDELPECVVLESVEVYEIEFDLNGNPINTVRQLDSTEYTQDGSNVRIDATTNKGYRLRYNTLIKEDCMPDKGGSVPFLNKATLTSDNDPEEMVATSELTGYYDKPIIKYSGSVDNKTQSIFWNIEYNKRKLTIEPGTKITDTIKGGMEFVEGSMMLLTGSGQYLEPNKDYKVTYGTDAEGNSTFEIEFLIELADEVRIQYASKLDEDILASTVIENLVQDDKGNEDQNVGYLQPHKIIKRHKNPDYKNSIISWDLMVNEYNEKGHKMINAVITDKLDPGLKFLEGTLKVYSASKSTELVLDKDYTFKLTTENVVVNGVNTVKESFVIAMIGDYAQTDEELRITYDTSFDSTVLKPNEIFKNHANLKWQTEDGEEKELDTTDFFDPDKKSKLNGNKIGTYDPHSKEITWSIAINFGQTVLGQRPYIKDKLNGNQKFVDGSLKAYEYEIRPGETEIHRLHEIPLENVIAPGSEIQYPSEENGYELYIPLRESSFDQKSHRILYDFKTTLKDEVIGHANEYYNSAEFSEGDGFPLHTLEAAVTIKHGGELITKAGKQNSKTGFIDWDVMINGSQSKVDDAVVEDTLSPLLSVKKDSVKVYKTKVDDQGEIILTDEELESSKYTLEIQRITNDEGVEQDRITVKFTEEINESYQLKYSTAVMVEAEDVPGSGKLDVSNKIKFSGNNKQAVEQDTEEVVGVDVSTGGGTIVGKRSKLEIHKEDGDKGGPLAGAKFRLERVNNGKRVVLGDYETDAEGKILVNPIVKGTYILTEIEAPAGFIIDPELKEGKEITIPLEEGVDLSVLTLKNYRNSFELKKVDEDHQVLAGVEFKLSKLIDGNYEEISVTDSLITDDQGIIKLYELEVGSYRLEEKQTLDGYIKNIQPIEFDVIDGEQIINNSVEYINYKGQVSLKKLDLEGNVITGAKFELQKSDGTVVGTYTTDKDGLITVTGLDVGNYKFIETVPAEGYIGGAEVEFEIKAESDGKPEVIELEATNESTHVEIKKVDRDGNPLKDAEFSLYKKEGTSFKEINTDVKYITDENGVLKVNGLGAGDYKFVEKIAPTGYIKNLHELPFTLSLVDKKIEVTMTEDTLINYQGSVKLTKKDNKGNALQGVIFAILDEDGQVLQDNLITDADGVITIKNIAPGKYAFAESIATPGHNGKVYKEFEIVDEYLDEPEMIELEAINLKSTLKIVKKDDQGKLLEGAVFDLFRDANNDGQYLKVTLNGEMKTNADGEIIITGLRAGKYKLVERQSPEGYMLNLEPLEFEIELENGETLDKEVEFVNYSGEVRLTKTDVDGAGLSDTEFKLINEDGSFEEVYTTNDDGIIEVKDLKPGNYKFVETKPKDGFVGGQEFEFKIVSEHVGKPELIEVTLENEQTEVKLVKVDANDSFLADVEFELYQHDGSDYVRIHEDKEYKTDVNGEIIIKGLAEGDYQLREVAALDGYIKNTETFDFTIDDQGIVDVKATDNKFVNYQQTVILNKADSDGNPLVGVIFELRDTLTGDVVESNLVTNAEGQIILEGVMPGEYTLKEIKALPGYNDPVSVDFKVEAEQKGIVEDIVFETMNKQAKVEFVKKDKFDTPLADAEFEVYQDVNGTLTQIQKDVKHISDEDGKVVLKGLEEGDYQLKEVVAPKGYVINETPINFTVEADQDGFVIDMVLPDFINYLGTVELLKTDESQRPLSGVEFKLVDISGTIIKEHLKTDANGKLLIDELAVGSYQLIETKALDGFDGDVKVSFEIAESALGEPEVVKVSAVNKLVPLVPEKPDTSTPGHYNTYLTMIVASLIVLVYTEGFIFKKKRR